MNKKEYILKAQDKKRAMGVLFYVFMVAPAIILYLIIIAYPICFSIFLGFTDYDFKPGQVMKFIGFDNYIKMFNDSRFWIGFKNNLIVVAVSILGQIPLGFILAYLLFRKFVRFQGFFQAMVFLPQVISTIIIGILWRNFFGVRGAATQLVGIILKDSRFRFTWFMNRNTAMLPVGIALLWIYTGFYMLVFLASLQSLNKSMIEAAQIDGANERQVFFRIIIPCLSGVIILNSILAIAGSLKGFDLIFALAPNDGLGIANYNLVLPTYMYHYAFRSRHYAFGSAISNFIVLLSVVLIMVTVIIGKLANKEKY